MREKINFIVLEVRGSDYVCLQGKSYTNYIGDGDGNTVYADKKKQQKMNVFDNHADDKRNDIDNNDNIDDNNDDDNDRFDKLKNTYMQ